MYHPILLNRSEIFPGYFICVVSAISFFNIHMILVTLETCLIPFVILTIATLLTIRQLFKSSNSIERIGNLTKERKSRDRKYAITSVSLNIISLVLKLPSAFSLILIAFFNYFNLYLYNIGFLLFFLNASLGFFIHMVTNSLFRKDFLVLFGLVKRNGESVITIRGIRSIRLNQVSSL